MKSPARTHLKSLRSFFLLAHAKTDSWSCAFPIVVNIMIFAFQRDRHCGIGSSIIYD
jgi:hypothetical protein